MAINTQKFLPSSKSTKGGSLAKVSKSISKNSSGILISETSQKNIGIIRVKVIEIDKILKGTLASRKKELDDKKRQESQKRREQQEEKLETKPNAEKGKIEMPKAPRFGIFDWIKNFIGNIILGYFAVRLIKHLPKIMPIVKFLGNAADFILDIGGKLLNGLVTFVDWGYKAYDATRGFIKNFAGENFAKGFDKFIGAVDTALFLTSVLAADLAMEALTGDGGGPGGDRRGGGGRPGRGSEFKDPRKGFKGKQGWNLSWERATNPSRGLSHLNADRDIMKRYFQKYGRDAFVQRFGEEGLRRLPGGMQRGILQKGARSAFVGLAGKSGAKTILGTVRPLLKRLPIVGALIDFGLSVALGEDPGRAAFKAIGAGLLGYVGAALGTVVPIAGNIIGGIVGGVLGDAAGGALYDLFFGGKKPQQKSQKVQKKAGGGITRGGKAQGGIKRTINKGRYKRKLAKTPTKTQFKTDIESPIRKTGEELDKTKYFGPILALVSKIELKEEPTQQDYKNVGLGLNLLISKGIDDGQLKGGLVAAFANGGMVDSEFLSAAEKGVDISSWISTTFQNEFETNAQKTMRMIREMREEQEKIKEKEKQPDPSLEVGPGGTVTGGNADFWTLVAIASLESGNPQGRADVAQSVYNRLASGVYGGKTIKELILRQNQYQPVRESNTALWHAISDKQSAISAVASHRNGGSRAAKMIEETASAIQNPSLQKSAAEFVGGRTDFWAESLNPPANGIGYVNRHGHRFGWFVGPAAIAYGRKNPGPAKAPALGDIIVMGGGLAGGPLGTGKVSAVDQFTPIARQFGLQLTSDYRPGDRGYHGKNRARDYSNDAVGGGTPQQMSFAKHLAEKYGSSLTQLIYTPLGYGIANGKKVGLDYWGAGTNAIHYHHVHVALAKGGRVKKPVIALIGEKGAEFVFDADTTTNLDRLAPGLLEKLNIAKTKPQVASILQSYSAYEQPYAEPEIVEVPVFIPMPMIANDDYSSSGSMLMGGEEESDPFAALYHGG